MKKQDRIWILKIIGICTLFSPAIYGSIYFHNFNHLQTLKFSLIAYFIICLLIICIWNYLTYGIFNIWINHKKLKEKDPDLYKHM